MLPENLASWFLGVSHTQGSYYLTCVYMYIRTCDVYVYTQIRASPFPEIRNTRQRLVGVNTTRQCRPNTRLCRSSNTEKQKNSAEDCRTGANLSSDFSTASWTTTESLYELCEKV